VRDFSFNLAQEISTRGEWLFDETELAAWTKSQD
jgi:hypothetical protein